MSIASLIDHTNLSPTATRADIAKLCEEAREYGFASVCVLPSRVAQAVIELKDSNIPVCTVIGFPLGGTSTDAKVAETIKALEEGATEADMVVNIGLVKDGDWDGVSRDIAAVRDAFYDDLLNNNVVKVIFETDLLTNEEKRTLSALCGELKVDFVKTSTGFARGGNGATVEDVALMADAAGRNVQVKASGGIRDLATAKAMVDAGATRLGTSCGIAIVNEARSQPASTGSRPGY